MKIRVRKHADGFHTAQVKSAWYKPWKIKSILDKEFDAVMRGEDGLLDDDFCVYSESDVTHAVEEIAKFKGWKFVPVKEPLRVRIREYFRGPAGVPGMQGPRGDKGDRGKDGEVIYKRGPTDIECPHCNTFRLDEPRTKLNMVPVRLTEDNLRIFMYTCSKCGKNSDWLAHAGLLFPVNSNEN